MQRVLVTGLGAVTPLGLGAHRSFLRLLANQSGIVSLHDHGPEYQTLPSQVAALVPRGKKEDGGWTASEWVSRDDERQMSTFMQYAVAAAEEALTDAGWRPRTREEQERTGIVLGSGIGSLPDLYQTSNLFSSSSPSISYRKISPYFVPKTLINLAAGHLSIRHHLLGPSHAPSTACTTGLHSIIDAAMLISQGHASAMLTGSSEASVHPLSIAGFARGGALCTDSNDSPEKASRPFDSSRSGFVIGEGAGVLLLESESHARNRGVHPKDIYAEIAGFASTSDGHHITAPPPNGEGAYRAMKLACKYAGVGAKQVDYINAHATSTKLGDIAEGRAIRRLLAESGCDEQNSEVSKEGGDDGRTAISSFKGSIGHLLGAAGSVEAIWTLLAMRNSIVPPTRNLRDLDPEIAAALGEEEEEGMDFVRDGSEKGKGKMGRERGGKGNGVGDGYENKEGYGRKKEVTLSLTNSFGFGGTNASLLFRKYVG